MADRMFAKITIGGTISASVAHGLFKALKFECLLDSPNDLKEHMDEEGTFTFEDEEVAWGRFGDLENYCIQNDIPFQRNADGKYEYNPECVWWRPGMKEVVEEICDTDANVRVELSEIEEMIAKVRQRKRLKDPLGKLLEMIHEEHPVPQPIPPLMFNEPQCGERGVLVYDRTGEKTGVTTGGTRLCKMEGCLGRRIGVRWSDGKMTWPCTKGMTLTDHNTAWRIG